EEFRRGAALGHVYADPDRNDSVTRAIPLEKRSGHVRRWALSLEAFRLSRGAPIIESPSDLQIGGTVIPVRGDSRPMRVRFIPFDMAPIPRVSLKALLDDPTLATKFTGKVVFIGVTAITEVRDQQRPEIDARRQRRTPVLGCIELRAPALDKLVEPLRFYQFIQTLIERMPRSGCQLRVRDPQTFLLLPLLARAHRHARILRIIPVHPIIFFVPRIQTCTTGC